MTNNKITRKSLLEDLVHEYPKSVTFLSNKSIVCVQCGEPVWGTLEEAADRAGYGAIDLLVQQLNDHCLTSD